MLLLLAALAFGFQEPATPPRMLLGMLAGHRYERVTVDAKGALVDKSVLDIGRITRDAGELSVPLRVAVYKDDALQKEFTSTWTCAPDASSMVMSILVFGTDLDQPRMRLETKGSPLAYPSGLPPSGALADLSIELKVKQGFLRVFGARTRITLSERRITTDSSGSPPGTYTIVSRVELRAYAWGLRIKRARFTSEETISPSEGLLRHVLRREDGGYSELRLVSPAT